MNVENTFKMAQIQEIYKWGLFKKRKKTFHFILFRNVRERKVIERR